MSTRPKRTQRSTRRRPGQEAGSSVVSLRIDNELRQVLERTARSRRRTLSALLREALDLWLTQSQAATTEPLATAVGTARAEAAVRTAAPLLRQPARRRPTSKRI